MANESSPKQPQVFINFRGKELRNTFVSYLVPALRKEGLKIFIDEDEVRSVPLQNLYNRIDESEIALAIFSEKYGESDWCLNELGRIMRNVKRKKIRIIPIFYNVTPNDVKLQVGKFGYNLVQGGRYDRPQMIQWRKDLNSVVGNLGMCLSKDQKESEFVGEIIKEVYKVIAKISSDSQGGKGEEMLISKVISSGSNGFGMSRKLEAVGLQAGNEWDDGATDDNDCVSKIYIRGGLEGIQFIRSVYVNGSEYINGRIHGSSSDGFTHTLELDYDEYEQIEYVDGYYNESTGIMQGLQFITNRKTSASIGYQKGTKFSLGVNGKVISSFHGSAEYYLHSLGVYLRTPFTKSELQGGPGGGKWNDGTYNGVRSVSVNSTETHLLGMNILYDQDCKVVTRYHGIQGGETQEFVLDYPHEYIISVEGTFTKIQTRTFVALTSLTFKTSKNRISQTFGRVKGTKFVLKRRGNVIVGFHGKCGAGYDSIGVYFAPVTPTKSELKGGPGGGNKWDDGPYYDGVRKLYVNSIEVNAQTYIMSMNIDYDQVGKIVKSCHGIKKGQTQEFAVDFPNEYLVSVEGTFNKIRGFVALTSLTFKTSKNRISPTFGLVSGTKFILEKQDNVIVGFHGSDGVAFDNIGVYFAPMTPSYRM